MISWIKDYIDKKVDQKFDKELDKKIRTRVSNELKASSTSMIRKIIDNLFQEMMKYENTRGIKPPQEFRQAKKAFEYHVRQAFKQELDNLRSRWNSLSRAESQLMRKLEEKANEDEFIQQIIDNINKKQLKK